MRNSNQVEFGDLCCDSEVCVQADTKAMAFYYYRDKTLFSFFLVKSFDTHIKAEKLKQLAFSLGNKNSFFSISPPP